MKIIGICGRAGSGKDEVARILAGFGFKRAAFADALKREVELSWGNWPPELPLQIVQGLGKFQGSDIHRKPTPEPIRKLLQFWGTNLRRAQNENYWVDQLESRLLSSQSISRWAIPDVRFPNEVTLIHALGGQVWLVKRSFLASVGIPNHPSEQADCLNADLTILNDSTLAALANTVEHALTAIWP